MKAEAPLLYPEARELTPKLGNRDLFSGLEPLVYMNHAGISPPSILVKKAVQTALLEYAKQGAAAYPRWAEQRMRLKGKLAKLIGAEGPETLALVQNTTSGIISIAQCFPWEAGDAVVVFDGEFPSNVTPWQSAAQSFGLEVIMLDARAYAADADAELERLRKTLSSARVKLVAVSAVQFQSGFAMPLEKMSALCHAAGAVLFVDAVQGCGLVPIDVQALGVDFLAAGAHKWLMGLEGAGFLYASPRVSDALVPRLAGWLSHEEPIDFLFEGAGKLRYDKPIRKAIDFLQGGNLSCVSFAALEASLGPILTFGVETIFEHVQKIHDVIEEKALELGYVSHRAATPAGRSGSLCLSPPEGRDVVELYRGIVAQGVACAMPDGLLRFSPHWPNAVDEAEQVTLTLEHVLG